MPGDAMQVVLLAGKAPVLRDESALGNYLRTRSTGVSPVSSMAILAMVSTFARAGRP